MLNQEILNRAHARASEEVTVTRKRRFCGISALHGDGIFEGGCGEEVMPEHEYACFDCCVVFHRKCLAIHSKAPMIGVSLGQRSLEDIEKHFKNRVGDITKWI